jgi:gas vesicle protein
MTIIDNPFIILAGSLFALWLAACAGDLLRKRVLTLAADDWDDFNAQNEITKKHLADAVTQLEATQKHVAEGLKTSGQAFQTSVKQAVADARASAQKVSEAVAAMRSANSPKKPR